MASRVVPQSPVCRASSRNPEIAESSREADFAEMIFHGRFFEFPPVPKCKGPRAPSMWLEQSPETGATRPLGSTDITPLRRYYQPLRHPLAFSRLPGVAGYTAKLLHAFRRGTRRASPVASCILVVVLWLPPRQCVWSHQSDCGQPCCLRPSPEGSATGARHFEATCAFTSVTARQLAPIQKMVMSMDSQSSVSLPLAIQATGLLTFAPVGLTPLNTPAFRDPSATPRNHFSGHTGDVSPSSPCGAWSGFSMLDGIRGGGSEEVFLLDIPFYRTRPPERSIESSNSA
jgi:hypothetical protein